MRRNRTSDDDIAARIFDLVTDFSLAIDCGAHRGAWTRHLVKRFAMVHAFEPGAEMFAKLAEEFGAAPNVTLHRVAVLDKAGRGNISFDPGRQEKRRGHYVLPAAEGDVSIIALDDRAFPSCGFLKIDIEGGELLALRGAANLIKLTKPVIMVEAKQNHGSRYGWTVPEMNAWLVQCGYVLAFEAFPDRVYVKRSGA